MRRRTRRSSFIFLLLTIVILPAHLPAQSKPAPAPPSLAARIRAVVQSEDARRAHWGIQVVSLRSGNAIYSLNAEKLFVPASTAKLFTAAAALSKLGPDYRYKTTIESSAELDDTGTLHGDLVLVGRGDPNLSARVLPYETRTERAGSGGRILDELAEQIVQSGVRRVTGDIVADDSYFELQPYAPGWSVDDIVWGYGAPASALSVNDNVVTLIAAPGERAGDPASIRQEPLEGYFQIENHIVTIPATQSGDSRWDPRQESQISVERRPGSRRVALWGSILQGDEDWVRSLAMDDPAGFAGDYLKKVLEQRGVELGGTVKVRHREAWQAAADLDHHGTALQQDQNSETSRTLAAHDSQPLKESLKVILKVSQNLHAELLLRTLGRERRTPGSVLAGRDEVSEFLGTAGLGGDDYEIRDGSGLSRQNLASPAALAALLKFMYASPQRDLWLDMLPDAGVDGSLTERKDLARSALGARVRAKTGSMTGVNALAGYITTAKGEPLAFAIFMNGPGDRGDTGRVIGRILAEVVRGR